MQAYLRLILMSLGFYRVLDKHANIQPETTVTNMSLNNIQNCGRTNNQSINETICLLTTDAHYIQNDAPRSVVLVLGQADTGFSETRFFTEENNSYENRSNAVSKEIRIRNGSQAINLILPNIIIDKSHDLIFYILHTPVENNSSPEVATASFKNNLAEHVEKLKILFVLNHSAVTEGNHQEVINLLKQANNIIKMPTKFRHAMSLVIANVESEDSAETIVEGIANFLKSVRSELKNNFEGKAEDQKRAEEILNALLFKNGQQAHPKISYMSYAKPTETSEDQRDETSLLKQRLHSQKFVSASPNDFLLSLSDNGKIMARNIAPVIVEMIHEKIIAVAEDIVHNIQFQKTMYIFTSFGNVIKNYKSLQAFNQNVQETLSILTFLQELYKLGTNLKLPNLTNLLLKKVTWIQNREKDLKFIEQVTGKNFPPNIEKLTALILQEIPTVKNIIEKMTSALDRQITLSFERLASHLQKQLAEQTKNQTSETSKQQLQSLSESLLELIETSNNAETYNQVVSEVQIFLHNASLIEETSEIDTLNDDINLEEIECLLSTPLNLWKWLHNFELLWRFIEHEKTRMEMNGLSEILFSKFNELIAANTVVEANLTNVFKAEVLSQSNLNARKNKEKEKFEIQLHNLVSGCNKNLTEIKAVLQKQYTQNEAKKQQYEKLLQDKHVQEGIKTQRIENNCARSESQLITKLANERQQNPVLLEEQYMKRTKQSNELNNKYSNESKEQERRCGSEIRKKEDICIQQISAAMKMSADEKLSWERNIQLNGDTCNQELNNMEIQCNQEKDNLRKEADGRKQELQNVHKQEESECQVRKSAAKQTCNVKATNAKNSAIQEQILMKIRNAQELSICSSTLSNKNPIQGEKTDHLKEIQLQILGPLSQSCNRWKNRASSEAEDEFEQQKMEFVRRIEACCYSNAEAEPRGGTRGTVYPSLRPQRGPAVHLYPAQKLIISL